LITVFKLASSSGKITHFRNEQNRKPMFYEYWLSQPNGSTLRSSDESLVSRCQRQLAPHLCFRRRRCHFGWLPGLSL